jgi:hypothetical protein
MSALRETEELIYRFLYRKLDKEEVREIVNRWELQNKVDEETQEEIRYDVWRNILFQQVRWELLLDRLRDEKETNEPDTDEEKE